MPVPYDLGTLLAMLKKNGLNLAEDTAKAIVVDVLDWFEASAKMSDTPYDDLLAVLVPQIKKATLELVDKIDGEVG